MRRAPHENVATVLVDPGRLAELELALVAHDLWVWPVATAPICVDGPRQAFQIRRRLVESQQGRWDCARAWVPVWVSFGESWGHRDGPVTWPARRALYDVLDAFAAHVRYRRGLGGVAPLPLPREQAG
ncbi:hypothetical protein [Nocardioides sp. GY 10127]|uniref:hypothetical protein n=1 Tax=Nocardioides sp. GY 10127 TaxID=2569762 RepID=UPI0010A7693E|nr:hypothetical protein [Nocardioides sp. GY 10127]TIC80172.1 hypothetical protein E8D37_16405 [Nocardioides sp. GY 10127]